MKTKTGFALMEVLVASVLLSLAGSGVYRGFLQAVTIERRLHETAAVYDPLKLLWMQAEKDLRNSVALRGYRFLGKRGEMSFPVLGISSEVCRIRYFMKEGRLYRSQEKLPEKFIKDRPLESMLLKGIEGVEFEYAYLNGEEALFFKPVWTEEPYFGIPKAVLIRIRLKEGRTVHSRLVAIPQGRWGHLAEEEKNNG